MESENQANPRRPFYASQRVLNTGVTHTSAGAGQMYAEHRTGDLREQCWEGQSHR